MKNHTEIRTFFVKRLVVVFLVVLTNPVFAQEYMAQLAWSNRVELTTAVAGVVDVVHVDAGMKVKQGDYLLTLEPLKFEIKLKESRAHLEKRIALRDEARRELDRANNLYERTLLSDHELQVAKNTYTTTHADFESASAMLQQAKLDYEYSMLRAPFDAVVIKRLVEKGKVVTPELQPQTLLIIAHSDKMLARAKITTNELSKVNLGQPAQVIIDGDKYNGKVKSRGLEPITKDSTEYFLDVEFDTKGKTFYAGQQVRIDL